MWVLWTLIVLHLLFTFMLWLAVGRLYYLIKLNAGAVLENARALQGVHLRLVAVEDLLIKILNPQIVSLDEMMKSPTPPASGSSGPMVN